MSGCIVILKLANVPKISQSNMILSNIPVKQLMVKHVIGHEGVSISFSKEGIALNQVAKITQEIEKVIPPSWLYNAVISTKVFEQNGQHKFDECYITGKGFKIFLKSIDDNIILEWIQREKREIFKHKVNGNLRNSISKSLPMPMVHTIMQYMQKAGKSLHNIHNINVEYESSSQKGVMPKISLIDVKYKNGENNVIVQLGKKLYDPMKNYSYDDLVYLNKPVNARVSSSYGWRIHPVLKIKRMHRGIDYAAPLGTPIYASADGIVTRAFVCRGYGNYIELTHPTYNGKITTGYAHLTKLLLNKNQKIKKGELIGYSGNTGMTTAAHLHYEIKVDGKFVNPNSIKTFYKKMKNEELRAVKQHYNAYKCIK
ncbi:M23 family metallopeptidase [Candidatus Cytomitobacter primus]|nr:M23 family metallopeptidase [Candidatus Cytomitobacter primus]